MKRATVLATINGLSGAAGHKKVLEVYNSQKNLPRGYKVQMKDHWCAATVSAVFLLNGCDTFSECSCIQMVEKAKKANIWQENDGYKPKPGDVVLYDWNDSGQGDNKGQPDHVGIVIKSTETSFTVREGNKNGMIGNREMKVDGKYIRGFICPKYTEPKKKTIKDIALEVIAGKWGKGEARRQKLKVAGYDYEKVQAKANELMKGEKK